MKNAHISSVINGTFQQVNKDEDKDKETATKTLAELATFKAGVSQY
jgi:hypothetical protein